MFKKTAHVIVGFFISLVFQYALANDLSQFFSGGFNEPARFISTSQAVTVTVSGTYRVTLVGAGGSGACGYGPYAASGGGGGGFAEYDGYIASGTTVTFTLGAGGAAPPYCLTGAVTGAGNSGGTSTATWGGVTLTAFGGGAGQVSNSANVPGGAGGTASGGTNNQAGGAGGSANFGTYNAGGGGGPGGPWGPGGQGGNAICTGNSFCAGGGGSIYGYAGGNAYGTSYAAGGGAGTGGGGQSASSGMGSGGVNALGSTSGPSADGVARTSGFDSIFNPWRALTGSYGLPGTSNTSATGTPPYGAATGGTYCSSQSCSNVGHSYFAGGGGGAAINYGVVIYGPTYGGGGGACVTGTTSCLAAPGGAAFATIERVK